MKKLTAWYKNPSIIKGTDIATLSVNKTANILDTYYTAV